MFDITKPNGGQLWLANIQANYHPELLSLDISQYCLPTPTQSGAGMQGTEVCSEKSPTEKYGAWQCWSWPPLLERGSLQAYLWPRTLLWPRPPRCPGVGWGGVGGGAIFGQYFTIFGKIHLAS